jgi:hypothetical protein
MYVDVAHSSCLFENGGKGTAFFANCKQLHGKYAIKLHFGRKTGLFSLKYNAAGHFLP